MTPIRIFTLGDDGRIVSREATPAEAEEAVRVHARVARIAANEQENTQ